MTTKLARVALVWCLGLAALIDGTVGAFVDRVADAESKEHPSEERPAAEERGRRLKRHFHPYRRHSPYVSNRWWGSSALVEIRAGRAGGNRQSGNGCRRGFNAERGGSVRNLKGSKSLKGKGTYNDGYDDDDDDTSWAAPTNKSLKGGSKSLKGGSKALKGGSKSISKSKSADCSVEPTVEPTAEPSSPPVDDDTSNPPVGTPAPSRAPVPGTSAPITAAPTTAAPTTAAPTTFAPT